VKKLLWLLLLAISFLAATSSAHAAIAFRKDCTPNNQSSNVASLTVSCGTTTAGDLLVIVGAEYNSSSGAVTVACTDGTNTYTTLHAANAVFYCYATNIAGGTVTTTVTFTGGTTFCVCMGQEFSGVATSAAFDVGAFNNSIASCTACTMPAITTTQTGDLVLTSGGNGATNNTFTNGTGYTISTNGQASGGNQSGAVEYQTVGAATTYTPVLNITTGMAITGYTISFFAGSALPATTIVPKTTVLPKTTAL
jgi:hypothetical protein